MPEPIRTPEIEAIVNIAGQETNFIRLRISQEMGEHHDFEVLVDYKTFDEAFHESPDVFMEKTNKKVVIDLQHADRPETAYIFSGMITNIRMIAQDGMHGGILFIGKSNTIELERGEMMQTYSNTNLIEIFNTITGGTMNLDTENDPAWKADIDFAIQYRESDWQFLQRLCHQYQERFYYTGVDLVIGPHPEFKTVNLTYDMELRSFEMCSRLIPNQFSTYYYQRENHATLRQDSPKDIENATSLLRTVSDRSDNLTKSRKPDTPTPAYVPDMDSLIEHTKRRKVTEGAKMMYVRGECKTCDVRIGRIISVKMPENMGGNDLGKYRVYNIVHEFDQNGRYKCEFEAIPADLEYIPTPKTMIPTPNLIECEVWNNEDPRGIGRIKVKFPFDERHCETWIPVMTPDAGGGGYGLGPESRGYSFVPEVSDTVAVNFLDGPELSHPVVVGSMFHGSNAMNLGGGVNNNIKTIITRSKHMIKFDDTAAKESITITDMNKNIIFIDTSKNNITITANNNMTFNATEVMTLNSKYLNINVEKDMKTSVGDNQQTDVAKTIDVTARDKNEIVERNSRFKTGQKMTEIGGEVNIFTDNGDLIVKSVGKVLVQGAKDARISRG